MYWIRLLLFSFPAYLLTPNKKCSKRARYIAGAVHEDVSVRRCMALCSLRPECRHIEFTSENVCKLIKYCGRKKRDPKTNVLRKLRPRGVTPGKPTKPVTREYYTYDLSHCVRRVATDFRRPFSKTFKYHFCHFSRSFQELKSCFSRTF